jgi:hypothetical protein
MEIRKKIQIRIIIIQIQQTYAETREKLIYWKES